MLQRRASIAGLCLQMKRTPVISGCARKCAKEVKPSDLWWMDAREVGIDCCPMLMRGKLKQGGLGGRILKEAVP